MVTNWGRDRGVFINQIQVVLIGGFQLVPGFDKFIPIVGTNLGQAASQIWETFTKIIAD